MSPRPMFREFDLLKLYPVVQDGRNVSVPDLGLHKRLRSFHKAEAMFAGLIYGSASESLEHPSLNKKQAIRVAWDHLIENPDHYACPVGNGHQGGPVVTNPGTYPVMSYGAAHRWEKQAAARGVSKVARSGRGFMRAYQRAGSWGKLPESWKRKRNAFVARHMAQVKQNGEQLWKDGKPSRRALALIMWAYMPPKGGSRSNPGLDLQPAKRKYGGVTVLGPIGTDADYSNPNWAWVIFETDRKPSKKLAQKIAKRFLTEGGDGSWSPRIGRVEYHDSPGNKYQVQVHYQ